MGRPTHRRPRPPAWFRVAAALAVLAVLAAPAKADRIVLASGDVLRGRIVERQEGHLILDHPDLGRLVVPDVKIARIVFEDTPPVAEVRRADAQTTDAVDEEAPATVARVETADEPPGKDWYVKVNASLQASTGNTEEDLVRVGVVAGWETKQTELDADLTYYFKSKPEGTSDNELTAGLRQRWLLPDTKWFWFGEGRFDFDAFQSWRYRVTGHGGPGYRLWDRERTRLDALVGLGARREWGSQNDDIRFEATVGLDFRWTITHRQQVRVGASYYQVVTDGDDYRFRSTASWRLKLDPELQLSLVTGYQFEYQSIADPDKTNDDLRIYVGLEMEF